MRSADELDALLKARAEIDEQLRRHKNALTVLFTDVVGSTSFFERNGDTAGLVMIHRHDELAKRAIEKHGGKVIKMIGDSAMAEFSEPASGVRAAVEIEREFHKLNQTLPDDQRVEVRIGVHTGVGFRKGDDVFGDVVNVTSRIVKRTAPAQILISRPMYEAIADEPDLHCRWLSKFTIDGRTEKEDIFEVVWTDADAYRDVQDRLSSNSQVPPRYDILAQIGTGGMGNVYKVRDLETGETVALKVLRPEIASDPDVQENFKRELLLARKITHKNVCRIYEFSRSNGTAYTSMELVEGESLSAKITRTGALPVSEAIEIARQVCAGLREAHAQGIVHRDLKPANIMIDRAGTVKIMDFGIARMVQRDGPMTGTIVGTPAYMAPEQAELKPVTACTDIYALGLLLYEMITGKPAFTGDTPVAVAIKQIREYPPRPREIVPSLTRAMDAVTMKCLQKDPAKRYRSVDEFETALVRASKAKQAAEWEIAVNRALERAEAEIRRASHRGIESANTFVQHLRHHDWSQEWRALKKLQQDPKAILGVAGMASAVIVFFFVSAGRSRTIHAQTSELAAQQLPAQVESNAASKPDSIPTGPLGLQPISSREVDLYQHAAGESAKPQPSAPEIANVSSKPTPKPSVPASAPAAAASQKQAGPAKRTKTPLTVHDSQVAAQAPGQQPALVSAAQPQTLVPSSSADPAASDIFPSASQQLGLTETATAEAPKASAKDADESKAPKLYVEVGSFKDATWANSAIDKLTQLGFHAVLVHKTLLWSQSYRVQVGPYANPQDIAEAQKSLAAQGFKPHAVN